jgi:signal transduction histidine kinase/ActR/RegA family two-component response regulator
VIDRYERLQELASDLVDATDPAQVASAVIEIGISLLGARVGAMWVGERGGLVEIARHPPGVVMALSTEADAMLQNADRPTWIDGENMAVLPLRGRRGPVGALAFVFSGAWAVTDHERTFLSLLAAHASHALEGVRLHQEATRATRRLRRLQEATSALAAARTPDEIARVTTTIGADALGAESSAVWLIESDGMLRLASTFNLPESYMARWQRTPPDPALPIGEAVVDRRAIWVESFAEYERRWPEMAARTKAAGRDPAFCVVPFVVASQVLGVASFSYEAAHQFSKDDREYLQAFAHGAAHALERSRSYVAEADAHRRAADANRAKDEFLAMLGHELRNPLAPIVTALDLMRLGNGGELAREPAIIAKHVTHLTGLVDDLLDVTRIVRGAVALRRESVVVSEAITEALQLVDHVIEGRRHQVVIAPLPALQVDADRTRLVQVLKNLLRNAAAYTPPGGRIELDARAEGPACVLTVRDNGAGIAADLLPRIFELFTQSERRLDRAGGGLGLGLAIVKNLVELHGGVVAAESEGPGHGAVFSVRWPLATAAAMPAPRPDGGTRAAAPRVLRVLVVDDNADAAELLARVLRHRGHAVEIAHDAARALELVEQSPPDLAILDIGLPGIDGYELARRLRAHPKLASIPLVALTGYGLPADRDRARAVGFDHHATKPLQADALEVLLGELTAHLDR